jgi:hypothetical protein
MILKACDDRSAEVNALRQLRAELNGEEGRRILRRIHDIEASLAARTKTAARLMAEYGQDRDVLVLNDLSLPHSGQRTVIDHLIIDRISGIVRAIENNAHRGTTSCDRSGNWMTTWADQHHLITSPLILARMHCLGVVSWLARTRAAVAAVEPVVLVPEGTVIEADGVPPAIAVMEHRDFPAWLATRRKAETREPWFSREDVLALGRGLAAAHEPIIGTDWARRLGIGSETADRPATGRGRAAPLRSQPSPKTDRTLPAQYAVIGAVAAMSAMLVGANNNHRTKPASSPPSRSTSEARTTSSPPAQRYEPIPLVVPPTPDLIPGYDGVPEKPKDVTSVLDGTKTQDLTRPAFVVPVRVDTMGRVFPPSGTTETFFPFDPSLTLGRFTFEDQSRNGRSKVVRLRQAVTGLVVSQTYLAPGQGFYIDLPIGDYTMTVQEGRLWRGRPAYFADGRVLRSSSVVAVRRGITSERMVPEGEGRRMINAGGTF